MFISAHQSHFSKHVTCSCRTNHKQKVELAIPLGLFCSFRGWGHCHWACPQLSKLFFKLRYLIKPCLPNWDLIKAVLAELLFTPRFSGVWLYSKKHPSHFDSLYWLFIATRQITSKVSSWEWQIYLMPFQISGIWECGIGLFWLVISHELDSQEAAGDWSLQQPPLGMNDPPQRRSVLHLVEVGWSPFHAGFLDNMVGSFPRRVLKEGKPQRFFNLILEGAGAYLCHTDWATQTRDSRVWGPQIMKTANSPSGG